MPANQKPLFSIGLLNFESKQSEYYLRN